MLRIGFLTTIGVNVGDEFIRNGIRAILDGLDVEYTPLYVNKHDPASLHVPCEDENLHVRDKFFDSDLFIQAGAPVYWNLPGGSNSLNSDWHGWMWKDRLLATDTESGPVFANLGAGSCQPWKGDADSFLSNDACADFAKKAAARARLTTVRDPLAKTILDQLDCASEAIACPAFFAAKRFAKVGTRKGVIGVNLMPIGSHYDFDGDFPTESWHKDAAEIVAGLRKFGTPWFIAHDQQEADFMEKFVMPGERIFLRPSWRDYLDAYGSCSLVVANRVHGAVLSAGFGVPSLIIGNDSRAQIGDFMGIPKFRSGHAPVSEIMDRASALFSQPHEERDRLLDLRQRALNRYMELFAPVVEHTRSCMPHRIRTVSSVPEVTEAKEETVEMPTGPALEFEEGWYDREGDGGHWWRWINRWADVLAFVPHEGDYEVSGDSLAVSQGHLEWQSDSGESGRLELEGGGFHPLPQWVINLPAGQTRIRMFWDGAVTVPEDDHRRLGIALRDLGIRKSAIPVPDEAA